MRTHAVSPRDPLGCHVGRPNTIRGNRLGGRSRRKSKGVFWMHAYQRLDIREFGEVTVVRFRDRRITEDCGLEKLAEELFQLVEEEHRTKLVVSLSSVDLLTSAALGTLITLRKRLAILGGHLKLSDMEPEIAKIFSVTRLDSLFDIEEDLAHAVAGLQSGSSAPAGEGHPRGRSSHILSPAILPSVAGV